MKEWEGWPLGSWGVMQTRVEGEAWSDGATWWAVPRYYKPSLTAVEELHEMVLPEGETNDSWRAWLAQHRAAMGQASLPMEVGA